METSKESNASRFLSFSFRKKDFGKSKESRSAALINEESKYTGASTASSSSTFLYWIAVELDLERLPLISMGARLEIVLNVDDPFGLGCACIVMYAQHGEAAKRHIRDRFKLCGRILIQF